MFNASMVLAAAASMVGAAEFALQALIARARIKLIEINFHFFSIFLLIVFLFLIELL
jgi:hypothetical protein